MIIWIHCVTLSGRGWMDDGWAYKNANDDRR